MPDIQFHIQFPQCYELHVRTVREKVEEFRNLLPCILYSASNILTIMRIAWFGQRCIIQKQHRIVEQRAPTCLQAAVGIAAFLRAGFSRCMRECVSFSRFQYSVARRRHASHVDIMVLVLLSSNVLLELIYDESESQFDSAVMIRFKLKDYAGEPMTSVKG